MKSDTAKRRKVIERGGAVELRQTLPRERFVEAGKLRLARFDELASRRSFDGAYHTYSILR
jgi:hypothetical protein